MKIALHAVLVLHMSHKHAAKEFRIRRSSLIRYLKKVHTGDGGINRSIGHPCILSEEEEVELSSLIQNMEVRLFGLSQADVRKMVYQYCVRHSIPNNFNQKSGMVGRAWMDGFKIWHPEISLGKPEAVSTQRASGFNCTKVDRFFEALEGIVFVIPPENQWRF